MPDRELNKPAKTAKTYTVNMQPVGRRAEVHPGMTLLDAARSVGVELASLCGGAGVCDSCRVRLVTGQLSPLTLEEQSLFTQAEIDQGFRLACLTEPLGDVKIDIPPESLTTPQRLQVEGLSAEVPLSPAIKAFDVHVKPPSIDDLRADTRRIIDTFAGEGRLDSGHPIRFHPAVLREISPRAREQDWQLRAVLRRDEVIAILPEGAPIAGLAVDVGTTKLAAYLVDLSTGLTLAKSGAMNPQIAYGEDVVSRIAYTEQHEEGRRTLQRRLMETLNELVGEMCRAASMDRSQLVDAVVVGNTVMHHLFAGLPVSQLGHAPYVPAASEALDLPAGDIGLGIAPGASVHLPPNIAGYVGADHVAMVLAIGAWEAQRTTLALDIGTNTEITLNHGGRLLCCSCASGPAFEGAHIRDGMRAAPGAIERVQIQEERIGGNGAPHHAKVRIQTIGDQPAVGICGSGILDSIAEMLGAGILDRRGALVGNHPLVRKRDGLNEFVLAEASHTGHGKDVLVTRRDVNEIQLAKGAIRAGIEILLAEAGIGAEVIQDFIVAGAFGTYISIPSAIRVGMFPSLPESHFRQVGNAAGAGARQMLVSVRQRGLSQEIAQRLEYIELSSHPEFTNEFSHRLFFPAVD
jgi:uncharacterized 2Fe-2S/4Fe-4S cluster protein (DUF4445 family)